MQQNRDETRRDDASTKHPDTCSDAIEQLHVSEDVADPDSVSRASERTIKSPRELAALRRELSTAKSEAQYREVKEYIVALYSFKEGNVVRICPEAATDMRGRVCRIKSVHRPFFVDLEIGKPELEVTFEPDQQEAWRVDFLLGIEWIQPRYIPFPRVGDRVRIQRVPEESVRSELDNEHAGRVGVVVEMIPHDYGDYPVVKLDDTGETRSFDWSDVEPE